MSPISAEELTLLPEPLSPRMASVSPRSMCQETSRTAGTTPPLVWNSTERLRTSTR